MWVCGLFWLFANFDLFYECSVFTMSLYMPLTLDCFRYMKQNGWSWCLRERFYQMAKATRCHYLLFYSNRKLFEGNKTEKQRARQTKNEHEIEKASNNIYPAFSVCDSLASTSAASCENGTKRWLVMVCILYIYGWTLTLYKHPHSNFLFGNLLFGSFEMFRQYKIKAFTWNRCPPLTTDRY